MTVDIANHPVYINPVAMYWYTMSSNSNLGNKAYHICFFVVVLLSVAVRLIYLPGYFLFLP